MQLTALRAVAERQRVRQMILGWTLLLRGGLICLWNFYSRCVRYLLFRGFGGDRKGWKWTSGFPLLASLFFGIAWIGDLRESIGLARGARC